MVKLRRYYNQNRKKIWRIIVIIAFAFALLRFANYIAKKQSEQTMENMIAQNENWKNNQANNIIKPNTLQAEQTNKQTNSITSHKEVIKQFVSYCNKKELENAYNMLTDECKEQMFNDIETFEKVYYNSAFEGKVKEETIEKWTGNTYLVYLKESALALGKSTKQEQKGDYITIIKNQDNDYRLNINSYIGYKKIDITKNYEDIKMQVVSKNVYMNYEEYKIIVENNTDGSIVLDSLNTTDSLYIEDSKDMKYPAYTHELSEEILTIDKRKSRELNIKFYNSYSSTKKIKLLVFANLKTDNGLIKYSIDI